MSEEYRLCPFSSTMPALSLFAGARRWPLPGEFHHIRMVAVRKAVTRRGDRAVKFGLFNEFQLPRPWLPDSEYRLYQDGLAQIELADRLGYDCAWQVEHHFLEEYAHSPTPEMFLWAASQRTKNIRLPFGWRTTQRRARRRPRRCDFSR